MVAVALDPPLPGVFALLVSLVHGKRRIQFSRKYPDANDYDALTAEIEAGHLKAVISRQVALDDTAAAYQSALNGGSGGKILLKVAALE